MINWRVISIGFGPVSLWDFSPSGVCFPSPHPQFKNEVKPELTRTGQTHGKIALDSCS